MVQFRGFEEEKEYHDLDLRLLKRIWPFVRPYRTAFGCCLLLLLASFGLEALRPWLLRAVIDGPTTTAVMGEGLDEAGRSTILRYGLIFLVSSLLSVALGYVYTYTTLLNGQRVIRDVRGRLYSHLLSLSPRYFDRNPVGKLVTRITTDVENLHELIATGVLQSFFDLLKILGLVVVMFWVNAGLALFTLSTIPVILVVSLLFRKHARNSFRQVRRYQARQNGFLAEAVGGVAATRIFGQEATVQAHFDELNQATNQAWLRTVFHFSLFFSVVDLVVNLTQAGMLYVGGRAILGESMTVGIFVQFWLYFTMITEPIKQLGEKYNVLQSAFASSERIFQILDVAPDPQSPEEPKSLPRGPATISYENLSFAYKEGHPILEDINFEARPGQTIAIVGPTGAGKSTIISMLSRLQDPDAGRVLLDGHDLRQVSVEALRQRVSVVSQEVFLFSGTILENVRLFDERVSKERVVSALEAVGALDFVQGREGGLEAKVEERGATFSQGEKQLLAFARALAAEPDVLVLDEATASIDSESEARIQKALKTVLKGRTCLVVAHRLSTVRDADQILVLEAGRIVERGRHKELLAAEGAYARMLQRASPGVG